MVDEEEHPRGGARRAKRSSRTFWIVLVAVVLAVGATLAYGRLTSPRQSPVTSAPKVDVTASASRPSASTDQAGSTNAGWCAVSLVDGSEYFGQAAYRDSDHLLTLSDVFYVSGSGDASGTNSLRRIGSEIYKPQAGLVVPYGSVAYVQPLRSGSGVLKAIDSYERKAKPKDVVGFPADTGYFQAVFLRDGEVFFGTVSVDGAFLSLDRPYFLRFKDKGAAKAGEISSLDQIALVPQTAIQIGPAGSMRIPAESVLYVENLTSGSPVTKALAKQ